MGVKALTSGEPVPAHARYRRALLLPAVAGLLCGALAALVPWSAAQAADPDDWAGEWVIWEGYQTGEETTLRLNAYPVDLAEFETALPPWAERLRGLCDPGGRFYRGTAEGAEVLACEPSGYASGLWREGYLLLGAMSDWVSALAPDPDLSLFGLGSESAENAPFSTSPGDRYFWGHTIVRTPAPEQPQGNENTAGANDWHGRCTSGPCAGSATAATQGEGVTTTTLPSLEAELSGIRLEETDMECENTDARIALLAARTPTRDWKWFANKQNISTTERIVAMVRPGTLVTVPAGVEVEVFGAGAWAYWKGPAVGRVYCEPPTDYPGFSWELLFGEGLWRPDPRNEPITISTPYVVTAVMGTEFLLDVTDAETRVVVLEGAVEVSGVISGTQTVTAGHATASGGDGVPVPQPTNPNDLAARYPWLEDARRAAADPPDPSVLEAASGEQAGSGSPFPLWLVAAAAAATVAALSVGGFAWDRSRRRARAAPPAPPGTIPPPPASTGMALPPPPPPPPPPE